MVKSTTKPKSATSYKETAFGILPRSKVVALEKEGIKKAQQYIIKLSEQKVEITPHLILNIHNEGFGVIFPQWAGKFRTIEVLLEHIPLHILVEFPNLSKIFAMIYRNDLTICLNLKKGKNF